MSKSYKRTMPPGEVSDHKIKERTKRAAAAKLHLEEEYAEDVYVWEHMNNAMLNKVMKEY